MMMKMEDRLAVRMADAFASAFTTTVVPVLVNAIANRKPAEKAAGDQEQAKRDTAYSSLQDSVFRFARSKGGDPEETLKELLVSTPRRASLVTAAP